MTRAEKSSHSEVEANVTVVKRGHPLYSLTLPRKEMSRYKLTDADVQPKTRPAAR